jgi:hypothetical protein
MVMGFSSVFQVAFKLFAALRALDLNGPGPFGSSLASLYVAVRQKERVGVEDIERLVAVWAIDVQTQRPGCFGFAHSLASTGWMSRTGCQGFALGFGTTRKARLQFGHWN